VPLLMSASPPKADIGALPRHVRFVPIPDLSGCSKLSKLIDDLVGAGEERCGNFDAERAGGYQVNDQFKLGRLHDR